MNRKTDNGCIQSLRQNYEQLKRYQTYRIALLCSQEDYVQIKQMLHGFRICMHLAVEDKNHRKRCSVDWDKMLEQEIQMILAVVPFVYTRKYAIELGKLCITFGILFLDVHNYNLNEMFQAEMEYEKHYHERNLEELKEQIKTHTVISFDIFDTLLCRKVFFAETVFGMTACKCGLPIEEFSKQRKEVEAQLEDPNIYEIYDCLQRIFHWDDETKQRIRNEEIQVEKEVLIPRTCICEAFAYALEQGKKVYLLSDMYLPKHILKMLLDHHKIQGYEELWVSCEKKQKKYTGMFDSFKKSLGKERYLHIGDNWSVDGVCAQEAGLDTYLIRSVTDMAAHTESFACLHNGKTVNDQIVCGLIAVKLFENPFLSLENRKIVLKTVHDVGYIFLAPVVSAFIVWLTAQLQNTSYEKVIFPSRDGYFLQILYEWYVQWATKKDTDVKYPESIYIKTSRSACMISDIKDDGDIEEMLKSCPYKKRKEILEKRFFIQMPEDADTRELLEYRKQIFAKSMEMQNDYQSFLQRAGLRENSCYAFVDLISSGTCQQHLIPLLSSCFQGFYLYQNEPENEKKKRLEITSLFSYKESRDRICKMRKKYFLLEFVLSSEEPSVKCIGHDGNVIYETEKRSKKEIDLMLSMQKGIQRFFEQYVQLHCTQGEISKQIIDDIYAKADGNGIVIEEEDFYRIRIYDDWSGVFLNCIHRESEIV